MRGGNHSPQRKSLSHETPCWVPTGSWFFITINCEPPGKNQLCAPEIAKAVLDAFQHNHDKEVWYIHTALLMPDHLHAILSLSREQDLKRSVSNWKQFLARYHGVQWQRDFFDHRVRSDREFAEKLEYTRYNPVRKGLCETPEDWPYVLSCAE